MFPQPQPAGYRHCVNEALLRAVPPSALRLLDAGCGEGRLGEALKRLDPRRVVYGAEIDSAAAAAAGGRLDRVFALDLERDAPPLPPGSLDCVLFGDVLEHLVDPEAALRRHRPLLRPGGQVLCSLPNVQHHSVLAALLRGDFRYEPAGLLDATHLRFFTYATLLKLLLDAGFAPAIVGRNVAAAPDGLLQALAPALLSLGLHPERTRAYLDTYQYIVRGTPLGWDEAAVPEPLSVVVPVACDEVLRSNLLASPCLGPGGPHQVLAVRGAANGAEAIARGLAQARHPLVVCVHQDVYLPRGWDARLTSRWRQAEAALGPVGVAGVYGVRREGGRVLRAGHVVDRDRLLCEPLPLPQGVDALDELLLVLPRDTPLRAEPALGFHLYGADLALQARERGLAAAVLDAVCFHNSPGVGLPAEFGRSAAVLAAKWPHRLPVATPCTVVGPGGALLPA